MTIKRAELLPGAVALEWVSFSLPNASQGMIG